MGAKLYFSTYKRSPKFKESTLKSFLDGLSRTLSGLVEHILEKSPLAHSFTRLTGTINPNIIVIKSNRGSCEAKRAKLLLKLRSQERISVKVGDEERNKGSQKLLTIKSSQKLLTILQLLKKESPRILTSLQIEWTCQIVYCKVFSSSEIVCDNFLQVSWSVRC